jgi:RNA polymerase sigma-70 factor (ECF subfamily)
MESSVDLKSEQKLIRAAQSGDENAVAELYNASVDKIYHYLFYRVESHEVAEDLTAEVFLRFVEGISTYQDRNVPLLAWLYQIAHARLVDHYRQKSTVAIDEDLETTQLSTEDDVDSELMTAYQQGKVQAALTKLKEDQRQVLVLRFIEGYNLQQTADVVGKTVGAVKVIQHRALYALSQLLTQQGVAYD